MENMDDYPSFIYVIQGILDRNEERRQALIEKDLVANVEDDLMRSKLNRLLRKDMILYNYEASVAEGGANKVWLYTEFELIVQVFLFFWKMWQVTILLMFKKMYRSCSEQENFASRGVK